MTTTVPAPGTAWPTTAVVGLGAMGAPMARLLAEAGVPLLLVDAAPGQAEQAAACCRGARTTDLAGAAAAEVVLLMLPDSDVVEAVLDGAGLLDALAPGSLILDMGSSAPPRTVVLAERAAARGVDLVDAPVSGGVAKARTGKLAVMAGGSDDAVARARPLLEVLGATITHTGPAGTGHAMKALNNLLSAIGLLGAVEVLSLGARFGLDPSVMLDVLNGSTGENQATRVKCDRFVLSRAFDSGFAMRLMVKDLTTATELGRALGVEPALGELCRSLWAQTADRLGPAADHTEIARLAEERAGVELHRNPDRKGHG